MKWSQMLASPVTHGVFLATCVVALAILLVTGLTGRDDHLARRWKNVIDNTDSAQFTSLLNSPDPESPLTKYRRDWGKTQVAVYTVPTTEPLHSRPTLRDLADIGQAHAIDFLANGSLAAPRSWEDLQKALIDPSEAAPGDRDPFVFDRTLVATVTKGVDWKPGDRMVWSRVLIQPINFLFAGYTVAATENETVRVTSIEATRTTKLSSELGLTVPGVGGPKASLGPSDEHTIKSAKDINTQFEKLGIDITPNFLRIIRESETGGDVRGNTLVSLSVVTDPRRILYRAPKEKDPIQPTGAHVVLLVVDTNLDDGLLGATSEQAPTKVLPSIKVLPQAPLPHCPLLARVWMLYQKREIVSGRESYDEGQQNVSLTNDVDLPQDIEIVSADDVSPAAWSIQILPRDPQVDDKSDDVSLVEARVGTGPWRSLVFTDYTKASKLARWLRLKSEAAMTTGAETQLGELNFKYPPGSSFVPYKNTIMQDCGGNEKSRGFYWQNAASVGG
jgi:hypothetical protein